MVTGTNNLVLRNTTGRNAGGPATIAAGNDAAPFTAPATSLLENYDY